MATVCEWSSPAASCDLRTVATVSEEGLAVGAVQLVVTGRVRVRVRRVVNESVSVSAASTVIRATTVRVTVLTVSVGKFTLICKLYILAGMSFYDLCDLLVLLSQHVSSFSAVITSCEPSLRYNLLLVTTAT